MQEFKATFGLELFIKYRMSFNQKKTYVDKLLWQALRSDDEAALNHLFSDYYNQLFKTGLKLGASTYHIEDAIQLIFIDLWKYRHTLSAIDSFEAYLKSSLKKRLERQAQNEPLGACNDSEGYVNRLNAGFALRGVDGSVEKELSVDSYEEILILQEMDSEKKAQIKSVLECLTPRQKEIVLLKYFEELSYNEIAERTALQTDSIYKIVHER
ncbi:MAG: sigma-70 family RNA polymerase sigma factor [Saprospiraceae bacterium]|nr:sigma-70 family RNA polymerase sigma factor [Saprospiraceae bacterium]